MKMLVATNNKGKLIEFKRILEPLGYQVLSLADANIEIEVEETGKTFLENAYLKAKAVYDLSKIPTIADDSGLEVDALNLEPGVYTARYAGENATDDENIDKLLSNMNGVPLEKRTARFVSAISCILSETKELSAIGTCEGYIGFERKGTGGFGYDPIFMVHNESFASMNAIEKDKISHRGKAIAKLRELLETI